MGGLDLISIAGSKVYSADFVFRDPCPSAVAYLIRFCESGILWLAFSKSIFSRNSHVRTYHLE
jgi:hypothetical protein